MDFTERTSNHISEYSNAIRLCIRKLTQTHAEIGMSAEEQVSAIDRATVQAMAVWTEACENADADRHALEERVSPLTKSENMDI